MTSKELALELIKNVEVTAPENFEALKAEVAEKVTAFVQQEKTLAEDWLSSEERFYEVIANIIDAKWDTGVFDAVDNILILKVVTAALKPMKIYEKMKAIADKG
jgi:hypothetical protein